jgi:hypothetical protein
MARLDITISEELDGWIKDACRARGNITKTALVTEILEDARAGRETDPGTGPDAPQEPPREAPGSDPDALRRLAVTLDLFFRHHLRHHPQAPMTEAEAEEMEARWASVEEIRERELAR